MDNLIKELRKEFQDTGTLDTNDIACLFLHIAELAAELKDTEAHRRAAIGRREDAEASLGPWRRVLDTDDDWQCIECKHIVSRGIYPSNWAHADDCRHNDIRPVLLRAESAETELKQAQEKWKHWDGVATNCGLRIHEYENDLERWRLRFAKLKEVADQVAAECREWDMPATQAVATIRAVLKEKQND